MGYEGERVRGGRGRGLPRKPLPPRMTIFLGMSVRRKRDYRQVMGNCCV